MQTKLFTIPVFESDESTEEMNRFLRGNKILEINQHFFQNDQSSAWCFCVKFIEAANQTTFSKKVKTDYKQVLKPDDFKRFSILRECRKKIANDDAIPAFAVFTDEELSNLARLPDLSIQTMLTVKGIGSKKTENFGQRILSLFEIKIKDETPEGPDPSNR